MMNLSRVMTSGLTLAILALFLCPLNVSAEGEILEVVAPSNLPSLGELVGLGDTGDITAVTPGSVTCVDYPSGYTLKIESDKANGKLESTTLPGTFLDDALIVTSVLAQDTGGAVSYNNHPSAEAVTTTPIVMGTGVSALSGTNSISLTVKQAKQATAAVSGNYTLKLTWTVSPN